MPTYAVVRRKLSLAVSATLFAALASALALPPSAHADTTSTAPSALAIGDNTYGQLGAASSVASSVTPTAVSLPAGTDLVQVAAGQYDSYALTRAGGVLAWGRGSSGALGDGNTNDAAAPVPVQLPTGVVATKIAAGNGFALALTSDGKVYAWGDDSTGELGNGTLSNTGSATPVQVQFPASATVTDLSAGQDFAVALTSLGTVFAWGDNNTGQLGDGTTTMRTTPYPTNIPGGSAVSSVAAGADDAYAVTGGGSVLAWGAGTAGQLGNGGQTSSAAPVYVTLPSGVSVRTVAGGGGYALAVTTGGGLLAWGGGGNGDLGTGNAANQLTPAPVPFPTGVVISSATAGSGFSAAVTASGAEYAWGLNSYGQLGDGTSTTRLAPVAVAVPNGVRVQSASAGGQHQLLLTPLPPTVTHVSPAVAPTAGGTSVTLAGTGFSGATTVRFGTAAATINSVSPTSITVTAPSGAAGTVDIQVTTLAGTSPVTTVDRFSWIGRSASIVGWGSDQWEQLGDSGTAQTVPAPVRAVTVASKVVPSSVALGQLAGYGISSTGAVYAWGDNSYGELGNGTTTSSATPVKVALPAGVVVTAVTASDYDAYALTSTGQVYAWGYNQEGQLGNGTTTTSDSPVLVHLPSGTKVAQVSAGSSQALARTSTGKVLGWGYNADGELGNGTTDGADVPTAVHLPSGVTITQIAAGYYHSLALTSTGRVLAWGYNFFGGIGDGTTITRLSPVYVALPSGVTPTQIAAGYLFSSIRTSTGAVYDWGYNNYGQVGVGTSTQIEATPVKAQLPSGVSISRIVDLYYGVDALSSTGKGYAWGYNGYGDVGNEGVGANVLAPTAISLPIGLKVGTIAGYGDSSFATVVSTAPAVSSISPTSGSHTGGTKVTITGSDLTGATSVKFGTTSAKFTVVSSTTVTATSPAHAIGAVAVRVTTPNGTSATSATTTYTYK